VHAYTEILIALIAVGAAVAVYFVFRSDNNHEAPEQTNKHDVELGALGELYQDEIIAVRKREQSEKGQAEKPLAMTQLALYVMAPEKQACHGYDLLKVLLGAGLKFGEMNIFHAYRESETGKQALFSLAQAVEPGTFVLDNMGAESYPGVTLFMRFTGAEGHDSERFMQMIETAKTIASALEGELLDDKKRPLSEILLKHYCDNVTHTIQKQAVA